MLQLELQPRFGAPCAFFSLALRRRRTLSLLPLLLRERKLLRLYQGSIKVLNYCMGRSGSVFK